MRKNRILMALLAAVMLFALLPVTAHATEFEPCYHCGGTGEYHCPVCGNTGEYTCEECSGTGGWTCTECGGKGYLICPSCGGDGKMRTGDGQICSEACGGCGGTGKVDCMPCKPSGSTGWCKCSSCSGTGKCECCVEECVASRAIGYKCQYCKGTGYMGTGKTFPPSMNDGTHNIPHSGDWIVLDQSTWVTYDNYIKGNIGGGSDGNTSESGNDAQRPADTPASTEQPSQDSGAITPGQDTNLSDPSENQAPGDPSENGELAIGLEGPSLLPENRDYIEIPARGAKGQPNMVIIDTSIMTETEKAFYYGIPDEELSMILKDLENIITTAEPGRFPPGFEENLNEIAAVNGYETIKECGLLPLYVDGGQKRDFTVQMKLAIDKGILTRSDIYIYRLGPDHSLECLGPAEVFTHSDGSVETLQFATDDVTTYFTSYDASLSLDPDARNAANSLTASDASTASGVPSDSDVPAASDASNTSNGPGANQNSPSDGSVPADAARTSGILPAVLIAFTVGAVIAAVVVLAIKKKKQS